MMEAIWEAVRQDLPGPGDLGGAAQATVRLVLAALLGGVIGYERGMLGRPAGMRTYMLVALGSAFFVVAPLQAGMHLADLSRVLQGILTGIGFLGTGAILKLEGREQVRGLTTAAGIWLTSGLGMAAGLGRLGLAVVGAALGLGIITALRRLEQKVDEARRGGGPDPASSEITTDQVR